MSNIPELEAFWKEYHPGNWGIITEISKLENMSSYMCKATVTLSGTPRATAYSDPFVPRAEGEVENAEKQAIQRVIALLPSRLPD